MPNILGYTGNVTFPSGHAATVQTWSATVSRTVHDVTPMAAVGMVRELGVQDVQGSIGGIMKDGSDSPGFGSGVAAAGASAAELTLTAASGNTLAFDAVFDSIAASSTVTGDATVTFNFQMSDQAGATITWG